MSSPILRGLVDGDGRAQAIAVDENGYVLTLEATVSEGSRVYNTRHRVTAAEIDAGHTIVTVPTDKGFRLVSCDAIAYGGAVTGLTTLDLLSGASKLVTFAQANLTESTVLKDGGTGATVLADGVSYAVQPDGQDITIGKTGGATGTATGVDIILSYTLE